MNKPKPMTEQTETKPDLSALLSKMSAEITAHQSKFVWQDDIKWPLEISGVKFKGGLHSQGMENLAIGSLVMVRPCDEKKQTHLGLYLGEFPIQILFELNKETKGIELLAHRNPAILVPKLQKIIWGCESWWGPIESESDLRQITDKEIGEIWYVKILNEMLFKKEAATV